MSDSFDNESTAHHIINARELGRQAFLQDAPASSSKS